MLQGLLGRDAVLRVVDKDLLQEVEELAIVWGIGRDELLSEGLAKIEVMKTSKSNSLSVLSSLAHTCAKPASSHY